MVGYKIAFDKSRKKIQNLVDSSPKSDRYYSDIYLVYSEILYDSLHILLVSAAEENALFQV